MENFPEPEILNAPLDYVILKLKAFDIPDPTEFPWITKPPINNVQLAEKVFLMFVKPIFRYSKIWVLWILKVESLS